MLNLEKPYKTKGFGGQVQDVQDVFKLRIYKSK